MDTSSRAAENLQIIRSLMERAIIYRAISAPTAMVAGTASIVAAAILYFLSPPQGIDPITWFAILWAIVLAVSLAANTLFIHQNARAAGQPLISSSMKLALWSVFPAMLAGGVVTGALLLGHADVRIISSFWMIFYGLGLLGTSNFSPRSIIYLGWSFLLAGLVAVILFYLGYHANMHPHQTAALAMALTFGMFHLIYAICVRTTRERSAATDGAPA